MIEWIFNLISFFSKPVKTGLKDVDEYRSCPRNIVICMIVMFVFLIVANIVMPSKNIPAAVGIQIITNGLREYVAMAFAALAIGFLLSATWFTYRWIRLHLQLGIED